MRGRTLRIFIMGSSPLGLRQVELDNWTGAAVIGTRDELASAKALPDLQTPSVYLLTDTIDGQSDVYRMYVGEAEDFSERGIERNERLPDWEHFIAFYSKDLNLTKAHVRWLEREVYLRLQAVNGRVIVANGNIPPGSSLPNADEAAMQTYLENMLYMLTALQLDFFAPRITAAPASADLLANNATAEIAEQNRERYYILTVAGKAAKAIAVRMGRSWILQPGSKLAPTVSALPEGYKTLRQSYIERGLVVQSEDGYLTVTSPLEFSSPSAPAAIARGYAINGKWEWRRESDNKRFSEVLSEL